MRHTGPLRSGLLASLLFTTLASVAFSQAVAPDSPSARVADALRLSGAAPRVDGELDDPGWRLAAPLADFLQKVPVEGAEPSERTEIRILYDDDALYVGARMHRTDPRAIRSTVTRRDAESDAEVLVVSLDTYLDRRTAYSFALSSGGVRMDYYHGEDSEDDGLEFQFDPVWSGRARVDSLGWTAEMRIPFSQLRFSAASEQVWGLQVKRVIPDKNEDAYWVLIPKAAAGYASRFGLLRGISGIRPSRRLEIVPYVAGEAAVRADEDPADPFVNRMTGRVGADLKMGLGPNLTLDATVNPDFGQVEADPAEVNLTAFETVFSERRPFFIEGNELLRGRGLAFLKRPTYFYSRRIGAPPHGGLSADYADVPLNTTILGATKITGRMASGLSIGAMAAATPRERARGYSTATSLFQDVPVEPPTVFGVVRLQQEVGAERSTLGWTVTQAHRAPGGAGGLGSILARRAYAGGTDWRLRFQQGTYELTGFAGFSRIEGDPAAILRVQRSSAHYFQRPDQTHARLQGGRSSMSGYTISVRGDKNAGRWSLWGAQVAARSPGFELNDLGQMRRGDAIDFEADFQLRDTEPHRRIRYWQLGHYVSGSFNYGLVRQPTVIGQNVQLVLPNFWEVGMMTSITPRALSDELTRGGPLMQTALQWDWHGSLSSQTRATYAWALEATYGRDELDGWSYSLGADLTLRPAPRWQAELAPQYQRANDSRQYVATVAGGPGATYGSRYVFSRIERSTISLQLRLSYAFTPDLTVEGYAEPFAASGRYYEFGELVAPRSRDLRAYGLAPGTGAAQKGADNMMTVTDGPGTFQFPDPDFDQLFFRSNVVLRWEWARGSTLFLIWQQSRGAAGSRPRPVGPGSLWDATTAPGENVLAAKITYWLSGG